MQRSPLSATSIVVRAIVFALVVHTTTSPLPAGTPRAETPDAATSAAERPNILLIIVDDLGYADLSSYGATDLRTPNVDRLVGEGMRFDNFYANCPVCSPTRASVLTGRYPDLVGVPGVIRTRARDNWGFLAPSAVMLPELLRGAGYETAIVGKWHLGLESPSTPLDRGFMTFHGFLGDMMDDYYNHRRHGINYMRRDREVIEPQGHATDLFSEWAIDYLQSRRDKTEPFFLYLAYNAPHTPIQPPDDWLEKVKKREAGIDERRAKLVALIEHMDDGIGRVLRALDAFKLRDKTLVVFVSDNGGQLNVGGRCGNVRGGKQDMYEGGLRVPACVAWPGKILPKSRSAAVALTMDLYPTLCAAAGVEIKDPIDGVSLLPLLRGEASTLPERDLVFVRREGGFRYDGQDYYAFRRGPWKLVQNTPFEPFQLYNLESDPREAENLADRQGKVYRQLREALRLHVQAAGQVPWQRP